MWQRRRFLGIIVTLVGVRAEAQPSPSPGPAPAPEPIGELMHRLAAIPESHVAFTEVKTLSALTEPVRSQGRLVYRRPGHLEKITTGPVPESLMVDDDRLSMISDDQPPRLIELDSEPALRALVDAVRGTLSGDLATLRRSYDVAMQGTLSGWQLILTPRGQPLTKLLRQITVEGAGSDLHALRVIQANGDQSLMTIRPAT